MGGTDGDASESTGGIDAGTPWTLFDRTANRRGDAPALRFPGGRDDRSLTGVAIEPAPEGAYASLSYEGVRSVVETLGNGLLTLAVSPGDRIAVVADSRMEWTLTDLAVLSVGGVVVPVDPGSSTERIHQVLADSGASGVVVDDAPLLERVMGVASAEDVGLRFAATMDALAPDVDRHGGHVFTLGEVFERGVARSDDGSWPVEPSPGDLATIRYTSGTTGRPRGVSLTHGNMAANVSQLAARVGPGDGSNAPGPRITAGKTVLSVLPPSHGLERTAGQFLPLAVGGAVAFGQGPDQLREDCRLTRPEFVVGRPSLFERLFEDLRAEAAESSIGRRTFGWAVDLAERSAGADGSGGRPGLRRAVADLVVFESVRSAFGGNLEGLLSGSSPLPRTLFERFHGMGLPIYEGYDLAEATSAVAMNPPGAAKAGTVGPPLPGCEVAVDESVAPVNVASESLGPHGELLVRGPNVADGYWRAPAASQSTFVDSVAGATVSDDQGTGEPGAGDGTWLRTGDVVHRRPDGYLVVHEQVDRLLELSSGEHVAPRPIEATIAERAWVDQCVVIGDGARSLGALVVPDVDALVERMAEAGIDAPTEYERADVLTSEAARATAAADLAAVDEEGGTDVRLDRFRLLETRFTPENGLLTETGTPRRDAILERFDVDHTELHPIDVDPAAVN